MTEFLENFDYKPKFHMVLLKIIYDFLMHYYICIYIVSFVNALGVFVNSQII